MFEIEFVTIAAPGNAADTVVIPNRPGQCHTLIASENSKSPRR
jgi:hypothetical protein